MIEAFLFIGNPYTVCLQFVFTAFTEKNDQAQTG